MNWALASMAVLTVALAAMVASFERGRISSRTLGLVAALAALAVAGRLAFAPLPNVKPTTDIVLIAGFALGSRCGFAVGAITALVSNMVFGQGPWTPWQMLAWGAAGLLGAGLARISGPNVSRWLLASTAAFAGLTFGVIMDISQWLTYGGTPKGSTLIAYSITSLPWNLAHAAGNFGFAIAFGPALLAIVQRAKVRSQPVWLAPGSGFGGMALPALLALAAFVPATPGPSATATRSGSTVAWLKAAQTANGGFPVAPGGSWSPRETAWAALALEAAGVEPASLSRPGGRTLLTRLEADSRAFKALTAEAPEERIGFAERLLLAATAAGDDGRSFGGRDLVAYVRSRVGRSGAVAYQGSPSVDLTAYAVLALRSAGVAGSDPAIRRAVAWLLRERQAQGGWSTLPRSVFAGAGTPDSTGAVLQALRAVGHPRDAAVSRAIRMLLRTRRQGGGWAFGPFAANAQSTALAVLGLRGWEPAAAERSAAWFSKVRARSGWIRFQPGSSNTPVWVTAQSLLAMSGRSLPLRITGPSGSQPPSPPASSVTHGLPSASRGTAVVKPLAALGRGELDFSIRTAAFAGRLAGALAKSFSGASR